MSKYILAVNCPVCGELIKMNGFIEDYTQSDYEIPVIALDRFEQETFECDMCRTKVYTPDIGSMCEVEEGSLPEDYDDYDDE